MDVLKNKSYYNADYLSRYSTVPYYYHSLDGKYIYGLSSNMFKNITYITCKIKEGDTLEKLALKHYSNPTLWWLIAFYNDIVDVYEELFPNYSSLKIPNLSSIKFGEER